MNDLIKRSDAIEAVENVTWYHQNCNKDMVEGANSDEHQAWYKSQDIYEALEAVPSADRPQGEWKSVKASIYPYGYDVECSVCGHRMGSSFGYKFCPMCGARMIDEDTNVPNREGADDEF